MFNFRKKPKEVSVSITPSFTAEDLNSRFKRLEARVFLLEHPDGILYRTSLFFAATQKLSYRYAYVSRIYEVDLMQSCPPLSARKILVRGDAAYIGLRFKNGVQFAHIYFIVSLPKETAIRLDTCEILNEVEWREFNE